MDDACGFREQTHTYRSESREKYEE